MVLLLACLLAVEHATEEGKKAVLAVLGGWAFLFWNTTLNSGTRSAPTN